LPIREAFEKCEKGTDWSCITEIFLEAPKEALLEDHLRIHQWSYKNWERKPKDYSIRFLEDSHDLIVRILERKYGVKHETPIHKLPRILEGERYPLLTYEQVSAWLTPVYNKLQEISGYNAPETWIVGRLANYGATWEDIDIVYRSRIKMPFFERTLLMAIPKEHRDRVEFIVNPSGTLVGQALPIGTELKYPIFEGEEEKLREKLKKLRGLPPKLGRYTLQMKTVGKALTSLEELKPENLPYLWNQAFINMHLRRIIVEKKFAGAFIQLHKRGSEVHLFTYTGRDRKGIAPNLTRDAEKLGVKEVILNGEFVAYDVRGRTLFYGELAKILHGEEPFDDKHWILHVYDILWYNGKPLHNLPLEERKRYLDMIKDMPHIQKVEWKATDDIDVLMKYVRWAMNLPGSEGAMLKIADSKYELDGTTRNWIKFKKYWEIDARVKERYPMREKETGKIIPGRWVYLCEIGSKKEGYSIIGKTFPTIIYAEPGDILRVEVQKIRKLAPKKYSWVIPRPIELREELEEPDSFETAERIYKETGWMKPPEEKEKKGEVELKIEVGEMKMPDIRLEKIEIPLEIKMEKEQIQVKPEIKIPEIKIPDIKIPKPETPIVHIHYPKRKRMIKKTRLEGKGKKKVQIEEGIEEVIE